MKSILLIGPMRAGKSTIAQLLADALNIPNIRLDQIKADYFAKMPSYDADHARALFNEQGFESWYAYIKPFEAELVKRVLADYPENHVIDFGAGHSVYEEADLFKRVKVAMAGFPVITITPCADPDEAVRILHQRDLDDGESGLPELNRLFVTHPSNALLATHTIYNQHQTPADTCDEILRMVRRRID